MYLNRLAESEKVAFYSLAHAIAASHDGISFEEQALLDSILSEMQIALPGAILPIADALKAFQSDEHKRLVLLELMLIALVDDDFADAEKRVLSQAASEFQLGDHLVERAASWAESMLGLFRSGQRFIQFS
ncbi:hypothetical protein OPU71_17395 [Niveibacterium sp. 24ML]|uniref:hypothetical protein n=1 Tax=Niveibacterium sp. 24ML TaxID=2985512 RepID=UPI00226F36AD|nr:hypothetical protein [Niveibacterium sp. 24ML]MCX9157902.1 hypothetical protein [Niveibacterium sp. 24ML]